MFEEVIYAEELHIGGEFAISNEIIPGGLTGNTVVA